MIDKPLLIAVMTLLTLSLIMNYSLSVYAVSNLGYGDFHFFIRQSIAIVIGFISMIILSKINSDKWFPTIGMFIFFFFAIAIIVMQFLPASLVNEVGGAKRWIDLGPMSIAPVEFFKVGFIFFISWSFSRKFSDKDKMSYLDEVMAFAPYIVLFFLFVVVIAVFQKDLGQVFVLGATLVVLILFVGSSFKFFLTLIIAAFAAVAALILAAPHRIARIKSWWGTVQNDILSLLPFEYVPDSFRVEAVKEPWQISNSLNAMHSGDMFGVGLGNGQFKLGYLSEVHTDFILAGLTEELGFVGLVFVTFVMAFILFRIFVIASKVPCRVEYLFTLGMGMVIFISFLLNAYGISGITPIKGIAVPFLSYGGSHILASCIAIGMILMISKNVPRDMYGKIL